MSPEITWRNGGPLMLGGLVGGSERCCCENPPPPRCWCPDYCQYLIEVTSPDELNVSSNYDCYGSFNTSYTEPSLIQSVLDPFPGVIDCPGEVSGPGLPPCGNFSSAQMSNAFMESVGLYASAYSVIAKRRSVGSFAGAVADVVYQARVFCLLPETTGAEKPQIFLQLDLRARVSNNDSMLGEIFLYARSARKTVRIDQENCEKAGRRVCSYLNDADRRIANFPTPLTFTTSMATTSFGDYDDDVLSGSEYGPYEDVLNSLVDAGFEATFRITSRPACNNIPADCGVPIEGRVVYFPRDGVAVYGYEFGTPKTDVYDFGAWEFAHDGVANGTAESPYVFSAKKFAENPAGFILEEHNLEVFCALDDTVTPPVSRWYVREFVYCTPEFGRQTTDQWISEIPTYPEPDRETPCEGVSAGDPVPVGEPSYQRVDGYPIVDFGDPCDPPPPIGLQITDGCS